MSDECPTKKTFHEQCIKNVFVLTFENIIKDQITLNVHITIKVTGRKFVHKL